MEYIQHRGPDNSSFKLFNDGKLAMGHTRLSIIDLSESANQPMCNEDESLWVSFNGEIYNYKKLRAILISSGHLFKSQSDSEILLHGYEEWGEKLPEYLDGMFAFAIYDQKENLFFMARDRFGIKPFHYFYNGTDFLFGSEIKSFYPFSFFNKEIDLSAVSDFFHYYTIPAPKTIWKNTYKLLPGHSMTYRIGFDPSIREYWRIQPGTLKKDQKKVLSNFKSDFQCAVNDHLVSDVPVGVFLSSGYDSSAILSFSKSNLGRVNTFTIGFKDSIKSEHIEAREISDILQSEHHELILNENYMDVIKEMQFYYDEPFAVTSMVSYYYISQLASEHNKVVLAGDGGDEVLAGYKWYRKIIQDVKNRDLKTRVRHWSLKNKKAFFKHKYFRVMGTNLMWVRSILSENTMKYAEKDPLWAYDLPDKFLRLSPLKIFQLLDYKRFIPDIALPRADRSSMAHSLEIRVPFLDHRLVESLIELDESLYFHTHVKKYLLNETLKDKLPDRILNLPKKGFGNPLDRFFEKKEEIIDEIKNGAMFQSGVLNKDIDFEVQKKKELWLIYIFHLWWNKWY